MLLILIILIYCAMWSPLEITGAKCHAKMQTTYRIGKKDKKKKGRYKGLMTNEK